MARTACIAVVMTFGSHATSRGIGAILAIASLGGLVFSGLPAAAFSIHFGPFSLHVPFPGHHYRHHHLHMRASSSEARSRSNEFSRGSGHRTSAREGNAAKTNQTE